MRWSQFPLCFSDKRIRNASAAVHRMPEWQQLKLVRVLFFHVTKSQEVRCSLEAIRDPGCFSLPTMSLLICYLLSSHLLSNDSKMALGFETSSLCSHRQRRSQGCANCACVLSSRKEKPFQNFPYDMFSYTWLARIVSHSFQGHLQRRLGNGHIESPDKIEILVARVEGEWIPIS